MRKVKTLLVKNILYLAWLQALVAMLTSLYFSEVLKLAPCVLCWYQRIFMYPLVFILGVGIYREDKNMPYYVFPLSIIGLIIALYHYFLQMGIIPETLAPCTLGVSCTTKYIELLGFINIPFMSMFAFAFITVCMFIFINSSKKYEN